MNDSSLQGLQAESEETAKLLAKAGVPEFVWKSLTISCAAAIASATSSPPLKPRKVTVISGCGKLGRFFSQQLSNAGHDVSILERNDWDHVIDSLSLLLAANVAESQLLLALPKNFISAPLEWERNF